MEAKYLFIDGSYAREIYQRAMKEVFGICGEVIPGRIASQIGPFRTFFYDCLDDVRRDGENDQDFDTRMRAQEKYVADVQANRGMHLRLGTLTGARKRRQKEVDVLLAVDMLTHGFNHTMSHAILLAGDLDFRPVVETLVRAGIFVEVWSEDRSTAKDLQWAGDASLPIDWHTMYNWSNPEFHAAHPFPRQSDRHAPLASPHVLNSGVAQACSVIIMRDQGRGPFVLKAQMKDATYWFEHDDQQVLERYFSMRYGPVEWQKEKAAGLGPAAG